MCPRCGSDGVLRIVYGLPGPELAEESIAGRVALGGCEVWPESPDWRCVACGHDWRDLARLLNASPDQPITIDKDHEQPIYTRKKPGPA